MVPILSDCLWYENQHEAELNPSLQRVKDNKRSKRGKENPVKGPGGSCGHPAHSHGFCSEGPTCVGLLSPSSHQLFLLSHPFPSLLQMLPVFQKQTPVVTERKRLRFCTESQIKSEWESLGLTSNLKDRLPMNQRTRLIATLLITTICTVSPNVTELHSFKHLMNAYCVAGTVP